MHILFLVILGCNSLGMKDKGHDDIKSVSRSNLMNVYLRTGRIDIKIDGNSLLHIAAINQEEEIVDYLIKKGANALAKDKLGRYADELTENKAIKFHIENGKTLSKYREYFNLNSNLELKLKINKKNQYGLDVLHSAVIYEDKDLAEYLLLNGSNVNVIDNNGRTALLDACQGGRKDIIELLILRGADIDKEDYRGITPLMIASANGHKEAVKLLTSKNADANKIGYNVTALHLAVQNRDIEVVKILLKTSTNIDVNKKDTNDGCTALHIATLYRSLDILKLLLKEVININKKDRYRRNPLMLAIEEKEEKIAEILLKKGSSFNLKYYITNQSEEQLELFIKIAKEYYSKAKYTSFNLGMAIARIHSPNILTHKNLKNEYSELILGILRYVVRACDELKLDPKISIIIKSIENDNYKDIRGEIFKYL